MLKLEYWKENLIRNISFFLSFVVLFLVVALSFFTWRWADDFCLFNSLQHESLWRFAWNWYNVWDGRGLMMGITSGPAIKYLPVEATNAIWASALLGCAYFIYKILMVESSFLNKDRFNLVVQVAAITVVLWRGMSAHISETVYWSTGGYYVLAAFFGLIWTYYITKLAKNIDGLKYHSNLMLFAFFIFSILIGMFSHNLSTGLLALGFVICVIIWLRNESRDNKFKSIVVGFLGVLVGTIIISIAPGNFARAAYGQRSFQLGIDGMVNNFFNMFQYYNKLSETLFMLGILVALLMTFLIRKGFKLKKEFIINISNDIKIPFNKSALIEILEKTKYLIAALATILPFVFVPDFGAARTSIFFMMFTLIFILILFSGIFIKIFYSYELNEKNGSKKSPNFAYVLLCFLFMYQLYVIIPHIVLAHNIEKKVIERGRFLSSSKNEGIDVILKPLKIKTVPFSLKFSDITSDPTSFINTCSADFYNLKSIKVEKK